MEGTMNKQIITLDKHTYDVVLEQTFRSYVLDGKTHREAEKLALDAVNKIYRRA
jgi:hypothetical protein